jgi:hypothetical protein
MLALVHIIQGTIIPELPELKLLVLSHNKDEALTEK